MIDSDKLKELEDKVHDLQWRMNQVCNKLSMEEETKSGHKFKIGDTVYRLNDEDGITGCKVVDLDIGSDEMYLCVDNDSNQDENWWTEEQLYPTREALIRAQVEHWQGMLEGEEPKECEHTQNTRSADGINHVCLDCDTRFKVEPQGCRHESDDTRNKPEECVHERNSERYLPEDMPVSYQYKKCGELYR